MLQELIAEQKARGMTDAAFATALGLTRETWNRTRNERQPLSAYLVRLAMIAFPHLQDSGLRFLVSDVQKVPAEAMICTDRDLAEVAG